MVEGGGADQQLISTCCVHSPPSSMSIGKGRESCLPTAIPPLCIVYHLLLSGRQQKVAVHQPDFRMEEPAFSNNS